MKPLVLSGGAVLQRGRNSQPEASLCDRGCLVLLFPRSTSGVQVLANAPKKVHLRKDGGLYSKCKR